MLKLVTFLLLFSAGAIASAIFQVLPWFITGAIFAFFIFMIIYVAMFFSAFADQHRNDRQGSERDY